MPHFGIGRPLSLTWLLSFLMCSSVPAFAVGGGGNAKAAESKGHGGGGKESPSASPAVSGGYVHHWIKMPSFSAANVLDLDAVDVGPRRGRMMIVFFLASWCEPCQEIVADVRRLEQRYQGLAADFVYVFAHDTRDDAAGFMREHHMTRGVLANHDVLTEYHNPELPTVYVGDRDGWLLTRYIKVKATDLAALDKWLLKWTAY